MVSTIDAASAESLINDYQSQNSTAGGTGLITPDGKPLKGFFIDRETLEHILHHHHGAAGVGFYFARDPNFVGDPANHFTVVFCGAKQNNNPGQEPYEKVGDIYCAPPPCPPYCTGGI